MQKTISTFCEECDSEFELKFDESLVSDHEDLFCPFCSEKIESVEEDDSIPEDIDDFAEPGGMWD